MLGITWETSDAEPKYVIYTGMVGKRNAALVAGVSLISLVAIGCGPKATVTRATKMANLQSFGTVLVRVGSNPNQPTTNTQVAALEYLTADRLRRTCKFQNVALYSQQPQDKVDLIMDLNIQQLFRGADPAQGGLIKFHSDQQATADVAIMLSDGINDELLGSAQIRGKSSAVMASSPESQAITAVADRLAQMMKKSGCALERVARAPEPKEPPPANPPVNPDNPVDPNNPDNPPQPTGPTQETIDQAEARNNEGKGLFRQANAAGAGAKFQLAIDLIPDPRYYFNLCLAREAQGEFDSAIAACHAVSDKGGTDRLKSKAGERISIIESKAAKGG